MAPGIRDQFPTMNCSRRVGPCDSRRWTIDSGSEEGGIVRTIDLNSGAMIRDLDVGIAVGGIRYCKGDERLLIEGCPRGCSIDDRYIVFTGSNGLPVSPADLGLGPEDIGDGTSVAICLDAKSGSVRSTLRWPVYGGSPRLIGDAPNHEASLWFSFNGYDWRRDPETGSPVGSHGHGHHFAFAWQHDTGRTDRLWDLPPQDGTQGFTSCVNARGDRAIVILSSRHMNPSFWDRLRTEGVEIDGEEHGLAVVVYDLVSGRPVRMLPSDFTKVAAIRQGNRYATHCGDGSAVRVWSFDTYERLAELPGPSGSRMSVSPDSRWLVAATYEGSVSVWDLDAYEPRSSFEIGAGFTYLVQAISNGRLVILRGGKIEFWDFLRGELLVTLHPTDRGYLWSTPPDPEALAPDGWVATDRPDLINLVVANTDGSGRRPIRRNEKLFEDWIVSFNRPRFVFARLKGIREYEEALRDHRALCGRSRPKPGHQETPCLPPRQ